MKTNNDRFVTDVEYLNRLIKDFTEQSTQLSEKVKTRKLNAIAARTRLKESQRNGDLKKVKTPWLLHYQNFQNALLEKIEETKLVSERLRAEYEALRKIEQNQNVLLQQLNS